MKSLTNLRETLIGNSPWIAGAIIVAGIVHITSILAMPYLAPKDAFARLEQAAPLNQITVLPQPSSASALMPFEDPATVVAVCRYDLNQAPLRMRGPLSGDGLLLFSFHNRFGTTFYSMTDKGALRGRLDVLVLNQTQLEAVEAFDPEDELPQELRLLSPTQRGFVIVRSLAPEPGSRPQARARIGQIACEAEGNRRD
ncbi:hypothetical protein [Methylocella sp. CPCC 101449]|jgi:uncharacterized membrane protein|uniref:DUF1254 domain-containing protein n=1 Tax=Methylocella sp. CPCC 101449 TaxID=2987531 RepID=UPI0028927FAD|nr:hypothetical protein [Methylocella sp. CPCC 101449]MDT2024214.1 hypothetical protein [Methylocella sp. CPCC 101449]HEV2571275.1 hypothetical protein [Beijerinckiaceae bacterium]